MRRLRLPRLLRAFRNLLRHHGPRSCSRTVRLIIFPTVSRHSPSSSDIEKRAQPYVNRPFESLPRLPPEIWDTILGFLASDRRALAACALTCRAFLPAVRTLVFHTVRLVHAPAPAHSGYHRFATLLHDSPHVALTVRDLTITLDPAAGPATLPAILPRLHEVARLTLNFAGGMFEMGDAVRERLPTYFHAVTRLRIENVRFDGTDLLQVLCACPRLAALHLCAVRWRRSSLLPAFTPDLAAIAPSDPVELNELVLKSPPPQVVAWLVKGACTLHLRRLELVWDGSSNGKYVPDLFRAAGPSMLDLSLAFPGWFSSRDAVDLAHNTHLAWLHFARIRVDGAQPRVVYAPDPVPLHTYAWVPAALAQVRSRALRQVHFSVELCNGGDVAVLDWDAIDAGLTHLVRESRAGAGADVGAGAGGGLVTSFQVLNSDHKPARYGVVDAIMYRLPRLRAAMGRLCVVYTHWPEVEECWYP